MRKFFFCLTVIFLLFDSINSYSQIKIFERNTTDTIKNKNLFNETSKRSIFSLIGLWKISFNEGSTFSELIVPSSYEFEGKVEFKKNFILPDTLTDKYSFILVAEGINYASEIKINNVFITKHTGGYSSIINIIDENILSKENIIEISVDNSLSYNSTLPLKSRIDNQKNYGGIFRDIYLVAVPKIFVQSVKFTFTGTPSNPNITSLFSVKTTDLNKIFQNNEYKIYFEARETVTGFVAGKSEESVFTTDNFNTKEIEINTNFKNLNIWSPDNPNLYDIVCIITDTENNHIDEYIFQYGFREINFNKNLITLNGNAFILKGINYFENSPKFATAVDFSELEKDILNIKTLGINAIRLPGSGASPYLINLANRYGVFIIEEIPVNEVPMNILDDLEYQESAKKYLSELILRDRNNPSILFWGVGNNFDVNDKTANQYIQMMKDIAVGFDNRKIYYTTRNLFKNSVTSSDITGINLTDKSIEEVKEFLNSGINIPELKKFMESPVMITSYGIKIDNNNRNGYSDRYSVESQTKYLTDVYSLIKNKFSGSFISSYSDRIADRPLNFPLSSNNELWTDGIYTIERDVKQAAQYVERMLKDQESPKILEGENKNEESNVFILVGVLVNIIFIFLLTQVKKFRESFFKCMYAPKNFFMFSSEQFIIPNLLNFTVSLLVSIGISLFWSSVIYFYRDFDLFDLLLANIFQSNNLKNLFSTLSNNPQYAIPFFTVLNLVLTFIVSLLIYLISLFSRNFINYKNVYTISVWSSLPFIIFLPLGTVILKLGYLNTDYIYFSILLFFIIHIIYLYRIISGGRILLQFSFTKSLIHALTIILLFYGSIFTYYYFSRDTFSLLGLILSYN
ncbi:MAG TPA: glycoside hydrolase family 2 TIM barrel-domain containing protein [Ignavibacteria bacterium]|nr:glycoside hydrolase family 2 TIM barrel-domain containing protein [Ignavibacteria bacterium]